MLLKVMSVGLDFQDSGKAELYGSQDELTLCDSTGHSSLSDHNWFSWLFSFSHLYMNIKAKKLIIWCLDSLVHF